MNDTVHQSVLLQAVCDFLKGKKLVVDCTLGLGGHSEALLERAGAAMKIVAFELDNQNLDYAKNRLKKYSSRVRYVKSNFANLKQSLLELKVDKVDGILLDLGLSSPHVDDAARGFSFRFEGPLDMRFDKTQELTAGDIVNTWSKEDLKLVLKKYGELHKPQSLLRAILQRRAVKPFETTSELAELLRSKVHFKQQAGTVTKVFQALRIAVNDELGVLRSILPQCIEMLEPGGRLLVISYHSLEDRIVKHFLKDEEKDCVCPIEIPYCQCDKQQTIKILTKRPVEPDDEEKKLNPRSRSAKMRVAEKLQTDS